MTLLQHLAIIFNLTVELNSQSDKLLAALHNNIHYYVYCLYALFKDKMVELNGSRYFLYPLLCVCLSVFLSGRTVVFGPPGRSRAGVIFFLAAIICWAYPMYFIKVRRLNTIKVVFVGAHFVEVGQKMFALYMECHPPTLSSSLSPSPFLSLYLPPPSRRLFL